METGDLAAHLNTKLGVEVRQRLIEQEYLWVPNYRAAEGNALTLPARELTGSSIEELADTENDRCFPDALRDLSSGCSTQLESKSEIVVNSHVRVQGVALKDHRDIAILRRDVINHAVADEELPGGDGLEAGDHPQCGALAAAGRTNENNEFTVGDVEVYSVNGDNGVLIHFANAFEFYASHLTSAVQ